MFTIQPRRVPGFAYHWWSLVGHRDVIGRLLVDETLDPQRAGAMYAQFVLCHIKFLNPFLKNLPLPDSIQLLFKVIE